MNTKCPFSDTFQKKYLHLRRTVELQICLVGEYIIFFKYIL
jgi:hypothetical protein